MQGKRDAESFVGEAPQFDDITMLMFDYQPRREGATMMEQTFLAKVENLNDVLGFVEQTLEGFQCSMKIQTAICVAIEDSCKSIIHFFVWCYCETYAVFEE